MDKLAFPFEMKNSSVIQENDGDHFHFEGMASTFGYTDHGKDVVQKGAFTKTLKKAENERKQFPVLFSHDFNSPIGVFTEMKEIDEGLFAKGKLPLSDTFVSGRIVPQMKVGSIRSMSIGFVVEDHSFVGKVRHLKQIDLWETSLVVVPMNDQARITGMKSYRLNFDDLGELPIKEVELMLKNGVPLSGTMAKKVAAFLGASSREGKKSQAEPSVTASERKQALAASLKELVNSLG